MGTIIRSQNLEVKLQPWPLTPHPTRVLYGDAPWMWPRQRPSHSSVHPLWQRAWCWQMPVHIHQKNEGPGLPLGPSFLILKAVPSTLPGYIYWLTDFLAGLYPFWL